MAADVGYDSEVTECVTHCSPAVGALTALHHLLHILSRQQRALPAIMMSLLTLQPILRCLPALV